MAIKVLKIIGILFFGYIALSMIGGIIMLQQEPDAPASMIIVFLVVGVVSGYLTRLLWKQVRSAKSIDGKKD